MPNRRREAGSDTSNDVLINGVAVGYPLPRRVVDLPLGELDAVHLRMTWEGDVLRWRAFTRTALASARQLDVAVVAALSDGLPCSGAGDGQLILERGPAWLPGASNALGPSTRLRPGSSNEVSLVSIDRVDHVHKRYRRSRPSSDTEAAALRLLHGTAVAPSLLASYRYRDLDGLEWPLGLLYRYAPGQGLDVPLRADLRAVLAAPGHGIPQLRPMTSQLLKATGALVRTLHTLLGTATGAQVEPEITSGETIALDSAELLDSAAAEIAALVPLLTSLLPGDPSVGAGVEALRWEMRALRDSHPFPASASPGHGDLHLGQIVVGTDSAGQQTVRLIDLTPVTLDRSDSTYRLQTPWQDLASLHRALEYFSIEEAHRQVAADTGIPEDEVAWAAHTDRGTAPSLPANAATRLGAMERLVEQWRAAAMAAFLCGYGESRTTTQQPLYRLLYLRRLLHELRYDSEHGRSRYAVFNLNCARLLSGRPAGDYTTLRR